MVITALFIAILSGAPQPPAAGVVVDAAGAPVAGATVAAEVAGSRVAQTETGADGRFSLQSFEARPAGPVTIVVRAAGFADTRLEAASGASLRVVLHPAPFSESVTVTATRDTARLATAASTSVLTSAELLTTAAGAIDDALRNTPGFSLFRRASSRVANPTTQGVTLRGVSGSGASRTMALADGWPLNDPFGSWVYWNRIPAAAIDRLEVVRGAEGDLYGADALGGVIQVLTFDPSRPRLRAVVDGGSLDTLRGSVFGGGRFDGWTLRGAAEWQATDGAVVVSEADRGAVDVAADSDYRSAFVAAGHARGPWHATIHGHAAAEDRGNGTPLQVNDTRWSQVSGDAGGPGAGGIWRARITAGSQRYFQTFSAVAGDRNSERLTTDQRVPTDFATAEGQWVRGWGPHALLAGAEYRRTDSEVHETRYAATGAVSGASIVQGTERIASVFARTRLALADTVDVVVGARGDWWESARSVDFFSPRASVIWRPTAAVQVQASASRAYRTPTLNELYRGFRVGAVLTNPNPLLAPERLTGVEGGLLAAWRRASVRVTAFRNVLDGAIANITIGSNLRERQNADRVGASGAELEMDLRLREGITLSSFAAFTSSRFERTPKQPAIEGNRVPQVPRYHIGFGVIAVAPRVATVSAQVRLAGAQFEDDLNELLLRSYTQVDASATRTLGRGVQAFVGVENLFDVEYDVGRTPVRTIGWPRTVRAGVRIFVP